MPLAAPPTKTLRTRQRIVDTAATLFWQLSYHAVAMDELAERAEVNKATIYRHFPDKAAIAHSVMIRYGEWALDTYFETALNPALSPEQRLVSIYEALHCSYLKFLSDNGSNLGCPILGLTLELGQEIPAVRDEAHHIFAEIENRFVAIARQAISLGTCAGEPEARGRTLVQLLHGGLASSRIANEADCIIHAGQASLALLGLNETALPLNGDTK